MLGAGGEVMTGLGVGLSIFVGIRSRHDGVAPDLKVIVTASNVGIKLKMRRALRAHLTQDGQVGMRAGALVAAADARGEPPSTTLSLRTRRGG